MQRNSRFRLSLPNLLIAITAVIVIGLLGFQLGNLTPGLAADEITLPQPKAALQAIADNPLEAPAAGMRLVVAVIAPENSLGFSRLPSAVLGLILVAIAFVLLDKWYGRRLAFFGIILLSTAPWFLHISRFAANDILYPLGMLLVMLLAAFWHKKDWGPRLLYASALSVAALIYIPGMLILMLVVAGFDHTRIRTNLLALKKHTLIASGMVLVLLAPLLSGIIKTPEIAFKLLGIAENSPSLQSIGIHALQTWQYIFVGGFEDASRNLGLLPIVNILVSLAFIVGLVLYAKHPKATRTKQLLALWLVGTLLVALQGSVSYALLLPLVVVVAVGGIGYLLHLWLRTFPHNPFARAFGIGLLSIVIAFAVVYNIRNYYVAWPNAPAVKAAFNRQF